MPINRISCLLSPNDCDRKIRLAKLQRETTELKGDVLAEEAAITKLENETERRTVRASISGTIGEVTERSLRALKIEYVHQLAEYSQEKLEKVH